MSEPTFTTREQEDDCLRHAQNMWIRARTNAFAHKIAASQLSFVSGAIFVAETLFMVIPIICVGLGLQLATQDEITKICSFSKNGVLIILGVVSIISNGIVLVLNIMSNKFQWNERAIEHRKLLASYQLIAQKIRRLDDTTLIGIERKMLIRHLEEIFEIYKATGIEPSDKLFVKAHGLMKKLTGYPFGLKIEDL